MKREQRNYRRGAIESALTMIPPSLHALVGCDYFIGADPVFAGLLKHGDDTSDGRSYRDTACCSYEWHTADKRMTICLPRPSTHPWVIIHELGHVLDAATHFTYWATPCTTYAQTNPMEAFAEAFTAWIGPECYKASGVQAHPRDAEFFAMLAT